MDTFVSPAPPRLRGVAPPAAPRRFPERPQRVSSQESPSLGERPGCPCPLRTRTLPGLPVPSRPLKVLRGGRRCRVGRAAVSPETPTRPGPPSPLLPHLRPGALCSVFPPSPAIRDTPHQEARIFQNCLAHAAPARDFKTALSARGGPAAGHPGVAPHGPPRSPFSSLRSRGWGSLETQFGGRYPTPTPSGH